MASITSLKKETKIRRFKSVGYYFVFFGVILICLGFLIFILTFFPIIKEEIKYAVRLNPINLGSTRGSIPTEIKPVDSEFGIIIPKILANARVVDNVDPYNSKEYQWALTKGVAHARGTSYPGRVGNIFIFAHSSSNWFTANQYNSVFYLVSKLEKGDEIDLYFKKQKYVYEVIEKKIVEAGAVQYLSNTAGNTSILTLMTCWPAGTSLKRLIIQAKIKN